MQDEHFIKAWSEGHDTFSTDLASIVSAANTVCRERLARLFSRAIPLGVLAGAALAAAASIGALSDAPVIAAHPVSAANFSLPYPA